MKFIDLEMKDHIGIVTYSRPPVNAVSFEANGEIASLFESINDRDDIYAVIFTSGGKGFVSGSDINDFKNFSDGSLGTYEEANVRSILAIYNCKVPVIAAVHGYALGLGVCFAATCDIVICSEDAYFGQPEVKIGTVGGTGSLSLLMPEKFVRYMAYTGKYVSAKKIAEFGSIHAVVPNEKLMEKAFAVAGEIAANYTGAVQAVKCAIRDLKQHDHAKDFFCDCRYTHQLLKDPKRQELLNKFYNKGK